MNKISELTSGCLKDIMQDVRVPNPILQILASKRINSLDGSERYRLLVSDGIYFENFVMLASQMNEIYHQGKLCENTIIRIDRYITSNINHGKKGEKRALVILELTVMNDGNEVGKKIGNPINMDTLATQTSTFSTQNVASTSQTPNNNASPNKISTPTQNENLCSHTAIPISDLTPYMNKWVIRALVMSKSAIKTFTKNQREGKYFTMELIDDSGEIRAKAFDDECNKYYDIINSDQVYYISRANIDLADERFSTLKNDYEISFRLDTVVQKCNDDKEIPQIHYNFTPILQIGNMQPKSVVDVLGIYQSATYIQLVRRKSDCKELKKRVIKLVDSSSASITLTLWGSDAENFNFSDHPVILLKNAKIDEYMGIKSLKISSGCIKLNPNIPQAQELRNWYDNGRLEQDIKNVSTKISESSNFNTEWLTFEEANLKNLGSGSHPDYYQLKGIIYLAKSTNAYYKACPQLDCKKKVIDQENGQYRCEKCNADFPNFKYQLFLQISLADSTSNNEVTCFNEIAEQLIGKTAQEIGQEINLDNEISNIIFTRVLFKQYIFKLCTKNEIYNNVLRKKIKVIHINKIDHDEYQKYLIKELQIITGIKIN